MFKDQNWRFARDAGDFPVLKFIGYEITKENNRFRIELLDALAQNEKVDRR
jgi:Ser/Thr protein kinase RdoA (MazF antagonist)